MIQIKQDIVKATQAYRSNPSEANTQAVIAAAEAYTKASGK